jgi:hypothetical protein
MSIAEAMQATDEAGISYGTLQRVKRDLGVVSFPNGPKGP